MSTKNLFAQELNFKFHDYITMFLMIKVSIVLLSELFFNRFPCFYQLLALLNNSNKCFFSIVTTLFYYHEIGNSTLAQTGF